MGGTFVMRTLLVAVLLVISAIAAVAAPSYFGPTGNILTPDSEITPHPGFDIGYHRFTDFLDVADLDANVVHGNFALTPDVEVGLSWFDSDNDDSEVAVNGKWRIVRETATSPAIVVGVLDLTGDALNDDASLYALVSKNLTAFAEDITDSESKPLRGTLGIGTGFYDGFFAGLDWTFTPKVSLMLEYVQTDTADDTQFNGGIRYAVADGVRLDAALIDFDNFAFGISLTRGL